jgi:hypothetical protein
MQATGERDVLMHVAMDQLLHRVRGWKATDAAGAAAEDAAFVRREEVGEAFQRSGLQPWEFHAMLHRAAEYGLADDVQPLWAEVGGPSRWACGRPLLSLWECGRDGVCTRPGRLKWWHIQQPDRRAPVLCFAR